MRGNFVARSTAALVLLAAACSPPLAGEGSSDASAETATSLDGDATGMESNDAATSESTSTQTTEGETSGWSFVPEPDVSMLEECDMFAQDCPEGEKCVPYGSTGGNWDALRCVPVTGDQQPGEPCTWGGVVEATDDCDETSACWDVMDVDGGLIGTCRQFCMGSVALPECPDTYFCAMLGQQDIGFCLPACDPIAQDCSPGLACLWADGFRCIFTTEELPPGQPCMFINECAVGSLCLAGEHLPACAGSSCCTPFCELEVGEAVCDAVPGSSCVPFFDLDQTPPGYEHIGACAAP